MLKTAAALVLTIFTGCAIVSPETQLVCNNVSLDDLKICVEEGNTFCTSVEEQVRMCFDGLEDDLRPTVKVELNKHLDEIEKFLTLLVVTEEHDRLDELRDLIKGL